MSPQATASSRAGRSARLTALLLLAVAGGWILRAALSPAPTRGADTSAAAQEGEAPAATWTCSMHPQVRRSAPGSCPICGMDLIPLEGAGAAGVGLRGLSMSPAGRALAQIRTRRVERRPVEAEVRMVGRIEVDEARLSYITAWFGGRIERMFVDSTGVSVNAGEHLVELYSPELYAAQEELLQARQTALEVEARGGASARLAADTLDASRERLRQWGLSGEQIAAIEERGTASDRVTIYAPQSGVVIHREAQLGMYVTTGTRIYTLADLSHVWVLLEAYESDLAWLRYGQSVEFTSDATPGETFEGTIAFIDPVLDPRTRTVRVRVNVENSRRLLKPEMFVSARVRARLSPGGQVIDESLAGKWICRMHPEVVRDAQVGCDVCGMDLVTAESLGYATADFGDTAPPLVVPASAVLLTGRRAIVYVELEGLEEPTFEGREVLLGPRAGDHYVVERGLMEGERVVVQGNFKIDSALQLQARPSMMLPDGGGAPVEPHEPGPAAAAGLGRIEGHVSELERALELGELERARAAFRSLEVSVDALEPSLFTGAAATVWRELAMVLGNDAAEGGGAFDLEDARRAADLVEERMGHLRAAFGRHGSPARATGFSSPDAFRAGLVELWRAYEALHGALAADDARAAAAALLALEDARAAVPMAGLEAGAHALWMGASAELAGAADEVEPDLESLRARLEPVSAALADLLEAFAPEGPGVFELLCPMAFDGRGARWLQSAREVSNPYFGSEMPRCGSVVRSLERPVEPPAAGEGPHDH